MKNINFPKIIDGKFYFNKGISISRAEYAIAEYEDKNGEKYFAKMWIRGGSQKRKAELIREIEFNKNFSKISKQFGNSSGIEVPKYAASYKDQYCVLLLLEKVRGKELAAEDDETKLVVLKRISNFLLEFNEKKSKELPGRKIYNFYFIVAFIFYLSILLKRYPKSFVTIFYCISLFFKNIFRVLINTDIGPTHRDINTVNILVGTKNIYLIDFQMFSYGPVFHELANMLYSLALDNKDQLFEKMAGFLIDELKLNKNLLVAYLSYAFVYDTATGPTKSSKWILNFNSEIKKINK